MDRCGSIAVASVGGLPRVMRHALRDVGVFCTWHKGTCVNGTRNTGSSSIGAIDFAGASRRKGLRKHKVSLGIVLKITCREYLRSAAEEGYSKQVH
jgi:hypothetical protein